jgi:hypothetical protein
VAGKDRPGDLLAMVPHRNRRWKESEDGMVRILVPRYGDSALGRWIGRRIGKPDLEIRLDDIGTAIWKACDGRTTGGGIARSLSAEFGERVEPVQERLGTFLLQLSRNSCILLQSPDE